MYPIIFAVLASFAFGAVAGVAIAWAIVARRDRRWGPTGGSRSETVADGDPVHSSGEVIELRKGRQAA